MPGRVYWGFADQTHERVDRSYFGSRLRFVDRPVVVTAFKGINEFSVVLALRPSLSANSTPQSAAHLVPFYCRVLLLKPAEDIYSYLPHVERVDTDGP